MKEKYSLKADISNKEMGSDCYSIYFIRDTNKSRDQIARRIWLLYVVLFSITFHPENTEIHQTILK